MDQVGWAYARPAKGRFGEEVLRVFARHELKLTPTLGIPLA
jgi:hypothetical protein